MPATLRTTALADLEHEMATTRRVLERVPDDRFDWKPHPKSMSLGQLASHLAGVPGWGVATVTLPELDFMSFPAPAPAKTSAELLATYDGGVAALGAALAEHGSDEELTATCDRAGGRPRGDAAAAGRAHAVVRHQPHGAPPRSALGLPPPVRRPRPVDLRALGRRGGRVTRQEAGGRDAPRAGSPLPPHCTAAPSPLRVPVSRANNSSVPIAARKAVGGTPATSATWRAKRRGVG